jgi:hypothetical protein
MWGYRLNSKLLGCVLFLISNFVFNAANAAINYTINEDIYRMENNVPYTQIPSISVSGVEASQIASASIAYNSNTANCDVGSVISCRDIYLPDNQQVNLTANFQGQTYNAEEDYQFCEKKWAIRWEKQWSWVITGWNFFAGFWPWQWRWEALWNWIWNWVLVWFQIDSCLTYTRVFEKVYSIASQQVLINMPINELHASALTKIEYDEDHLGAHPKLDISTTYPHPFSINIKTQKR